MLVETGVSEAFTILDRLRKKISQLAFNVGGDTQIPITASIGYAVHSGHPITTCCCAMPIMRCTPPNARGATA